MIEKVPRKKIEKVDEEKIFSRKRVSFAPNLISDIFLSEYRIAGYLVKGVRANDYHP